ncbi:NAD(P)-binding protein [Schizophyllum commune H4-8]|uniref:CoA-binding domain-containing protein n=1 Tax=Schizophyllum commune (strain H4-8 / FGSC 9210) TaxID=578458 RepID=D8QB89_SCHCM|nr:NAD(P)-binding protein [Schizophyllum commune H4-8]KAI5889076.1 NAD(P)-binding protein [Schizophyllum commune H4-8]
MQQAIKKTFLSSPAFAVVGASKDQSKWGTKVLQWYKARDYKVTPVHPVEPELEGIPAVKTLADLPNPSQTSVSVITPAPITLKLLQQAKELNVPALWLQPGTFDNDVTSFIETSGLKDRVIYGGHQCILVEGDGIRSNL